MNRRGFLKAAAALPAVPVLSALPATAMLYGGAAGGSMVMTATEVLARQAAVLAMAEMAINPPLLLDVDGMIRQLITGTNIPREWLK